MKMRNILMASLAMVAAMTVAIPSFSSAKTVLRWGYPSTQKEASNPAMVSFCKKISDRTKGEYTVKIFYGGTLGSDRERAEMAQQGTLDISQIGQGNFNIFIPSIQALDLPYIINPAKIKEFREAFDQKNGAIFKYIDKECQKIGLKLIYATDTGFRSYAFIKGKKIENYASAKGLKIRTPTTPAEMAFINAIGMNPAPISWPETYTALQQGTVDGELLNMSTVLTASRADVEDSILLTEHNCAMTFVIMSKKVYDKLSPEVQKIIMETAWETQKMTIGLYDEQFKKGYAYCEANKIKLIRLTDAEKAELHAKAKEVRAEFSKKIDPEFLKILANFQ